MLKSILKSTLSRLLYTKLYHIPFNMVYITTQDPNYVDILPTTNVPTGQAEAQGASTTVEYMSRLQILSKADKIRRRELFVQLDPYQKLLIFW